MAKWKRVKNKAHEDWDRNMQQADMTWTEESREAGADVWGAGEMGWIMRGMEAMNTMVIYIQDNQWTKGNTLEKKVIL